MRVFVAGILFGAMVALLTGFSNKQPDQQIALEASSNEYFEEFSSRRPPKDVNAEKEKSPSKVHESTGFLKAKLISEKLFQIRLEENYFEMENSIYDFDGLTEEKKAAVEEAIKQFELTKRETDYIGEVDYPIDNRTVHARFFLTRKINVGAEEDKKYFTIYYIGHDGVNESFRREAAIYEPLLFREGRFYTDMNLFRSMNTVDMGDKLHLILPDPDAGTSGMVKVIRQSGEVVERNFEWRVVENQEEANNFLLFFQKQGIDAMRAESRALQAYGVQ